ncbi:MAG: TRAP transporter large permease [Candidatus Accumulibacter sp.]|jgi:tripartite ATP-independent transporter DctM subunit|nr:TRAP transporter large permease [Accumulibacter sp.]
MGTAAVAVIFVAALLVGIPIAFVLGTAAIYYFMFVGRLPMEIAGQMIGQKLYAGCDNFILLAIYFFILAGELMNRSKITDSLIEFSKILVGKIPGALAQVNIVVSVFFAGITGSGVADTAAIGSVLIPAMKKEGYTAEYATAITVTSSVIGPIIPPSVVMVIYSMSTGASVGALFAAGFIPGLAIALALSVLAFYYAIKYRHPRRTEDISFQQALTTTRKSIVALLCPVVLVGGIFSGSFTPTEAAAIACFYAIIGGRFILGTLTVKDIILSFRKAAVSGSVILLIISMAALFGQFMALERVPAQMAQLILGITHNKYAFLALVNVLLLFMGMVMETGATVILLAPILVPIAMQLGIHPVHFALVMIVNLNIGLSTPPVGVCLFAAAPIAGISLERISRAAMPFVLAELVALMFITYIPDLVLFIPRLMGYA